jgi:hypothetical protein
VVGLIKDYDYEINYYPGKANVIVDTLSRKSTVELAALGISCDIPHCLGMEMCLYVHFHLQ